MKELPLLPSPALFNIDVPRFNRGQEFRVDFSHILRDTRNFMRLPEEVKKSNNPIAIKNMFSGAVQQAIDDVKRKSNIAIPQYREGVYQFLIPLKISEDTPQLALVLQDRGGYYTGETCLTIEMAYNNARLISTLDDTWLYDAWIKYLETKEDTAEIYYTIYLDNKIPMSELKDKNMLLTAMLPNNTVIKGVAKGATVLGALGTAVSTGSLFGKNSRKKTGKQKLFKSTF